MNNNSPDIIIKIQKDKIKKPLKIILYIIPFIALFIININIDYIALNSGVRHTANLTLIVLMLFNITLILKNIFKFDNKFNTMINGSFALFLLCEKIYHFMANMGGDSDLDFLNSMPYLFLMMAVVHIAAFLIWFIINSIIIKIKKNNT